MKRYNFYWKNGEVETAVGTSVSDAFSKLGYGGGAIAALDYYEEV